MGRSARRDILEFLKTNAHHRRIWYARSQSAAIRFNSIALYTLTFRFTNSGLAVGGVMLCQFLPAAFVGPFAGVVVDRLPRKAVMITADIVRALLVLSLLFVCSPEMVWLISVIILKVATAAFFEPARAASIPNVVARRDIVIANAVSSITWSIALGVGGALGGIVTDIAGPYMALVIDSLTFLLSAWFISTIAIPSPAPSPRGPGSGVRELAEAACGFSSATATWPFTPASRRRTR